MWIMTTRKRRRSETPGLSVYIGAIEVARIVFLNAKRSKKAVLLFTLNGDQEPEQYIDMSEAMKRVHELLNSPSPEDAN